MTRISAFLLLLSLTSFDATAASRIAAKDASASPLASVKLSPAQTPASAPIALAEFAIPPVSDDPAIHQTNPVIASDGESFLIVWRESTECCFWRDNQQTTGALYAARLSFRGERIGQPTLLSSVATTSIPGAAFDGTNYLVVWNESVPLGARLVGLRLSRELTPLDVTPFVIRSPVPSPNADWPGLWFRGLPDGFRPWICPGLEERRRAQSLTRDGWSEKLRDPHG